MQLMLFGSIQLSQFVQKKPFQFGILPALRIGLLFVDCFFHMAVFIEEGQKACRAPPGVARILYYYHKRIYGKSKDGVDKNPGK
jgi:hypothetical protein